MECAYCIENVLVRTAQYDEVVGLTLFLGSLSLFFSDSTRKYWWESKSVVRTLRITYRAMWKIVILFWPMYYLYFWESGDFLATTTGFFAKKRGIILPKPYQIISFPTSCPRKPEFKLILQPLNLPGRFPRPYYSY